MKISVITVCRNARQTIADTLRSVRVQTGVDVEHILIDGASTDGTMAVVEAHRDGLAHVVSEPDSGIYHAMNKGIALASGEVVGTLNADDVYSHPRVLAQVANCLQDPGLDACHADLVYVHRRDTSRIVRYWTSRPFTPGLFRRGWIPAHPTFFMRRRCYEAFGGFDLDYHIHGDFELTLRMLEVHRVPSHYHPEVWVRMRMGGKTNNSVINVIKGNIESYRACKRHGLSVTPWFFVVKIASRLPQFFRRPATIAPSHLAG